MTWAVERYSVDALLRPDAGVRVMRPLLGDVAVHWHDYYELSLVTAGEAEHVVNGAVHGLRRGHAFLLTPADFHELRVSGPEPLECYNVVVEAALVERHLAGLLPARGLADLPWHTEDLLDAAPDLERLAREIEEPGVGSRILVEGLVGSVLVELARRCAADAPIDRGVAAPVVDGALRDAVLFLDRHFREPVRLADVAARAHLSPNYFSERFRTYTGTPFQTYLQERRLRFAHALLSSTSLSVTEVCHAAGFNTLSHFGRAYRARYGSPPSTGHRGAREGSVRGRV